MTVAPLGMERTAVLRAPARPTGMPAVAVGTVSSERQNTSGAVSDVLLPHAPTVPTNGAGTPGPQSNPSVFPTTTKSPFWSTW